MKKIKSLAVLCAAGLLIAAVGCKSAPPAEPEPDPQPSLSQADTTDKPADAALDALRDKMEALRTENLRYGLDKVDPGAWQAAEASRQTGLDAYGKNYTQAEASFRDAISRYEALQAASMDKLVAEQDAELMAARQAALDVNAQAYYPEQFALADDTADRSRSSRLDGDLPQAYNLGTIAIMQYRTLIKGREAVELKNKIDRNAFTDIYPDDYKAAGIKYTESLTIYGTMHAESYSSMEEAVALFFKVKNEGFRIMSEDMAVRVGEIRALCDSIRAQRSMKTEYDAALARYQEGRASATANDFESAYVAWSDSAVQFTTVYQEVTLRRNAADLAIAAARSRQQASAELARKADEIAPLPEGTPGFEAEDDDSATAVEDSGSSAGETAEEAR